MVITEVRIKLMEDNNERLLAFCSVTFDDAFVVRDLKIIEGAKGSFVAMPSRKLTDRCPQCGYKNHLRARFCNQCATVLCVTCRSSRTALIESGDPTSSGRRSIRSSRFPRSCTRSRLATSSRISRVR